MKPCKLPASPFVVGRNAHLLGRLTTASCRRFRPGGTQTPGRACDAIQCPFRDCDYSQLRASQKFDVQYKASALSTRARIAQPQRFIGLRMSGCQVRRNRNLGRLETDVIYITQTRLSVHSPLSYSGSIWPCTDVKVCVARHLAAPFDDTFWRMQLKVTYKYTR